MNANVGVWAALGLGLALALVSAPAAAAKCDRADARLAKTGKGDKDGDGISNCRERLIDYVRLDTRTPFDRALLAYLNKRSMLG